MKIVCVPLDERPCNMVFPQLIANTRKDITLCMPDRACLGDKKTPADVDALWDFLFENIATCDYVIVSLDMLLYGGLIPSRIHTLEKDVLKERIHNLRILKSKNANCKVYAFQCIMRAPHYNSSEEEPEYYETYGEALFQRAYYEDKKQRVGLSKEEELCLSNINIPRNVRKDYEERRSLNLAMNLETLQVLKDGYLDFLVIPQDDSSEYGYTAIAQKAVYTSIQEQRLDFLSSVYPGADEVACSLMARALNDYLSRKVLIYPFYASTFGPSIIPLYEDRPMFESLKAHVRICGGVLCDTLEEADFALAINAPGKRMQESFDQRGKLDISYVSHRNLFTFVDKIKDILTMEKPIALCDSAFSNGGDLSLIEYLDQLQIFDQLLAYAGWNTNCNSLGTCLSSAMFAFDCPSSTGQLHHLFYRLIEDVFYQADVRQEMIHTMLPSEELTYYDFKGKQALVEDEIRKRLLERLNKLNVAKRYEVDITSVSMPWKRMFEIGLDLKITKK